MNLKKGKVFTSKFVGTGPPSYKKNLPDRGLTGLSDTQTDAPNDVKAGTERAAKPRVAY